VAQGGSGAATEGSGAGGCEAEAAGFGAEPGEAGLKDIATGTFIVGLSAPEAWQIQINLLVAGRQSCEGYHTILN
jgi:hypothetical protein